MVLIKNKAIPAKPRSKNYPTGTTIVRSGSSGGTSVGGGTGESSVLSKDIKVNSPQTGHIQTDTVLTKGMTPEQIFRQMFYKPVPATLVGRLSTANDVEYGTARGTITYTATRNDNGAMQKAYFDNKEENKLEFSAEVNGVQTATRKLTGNYMAGESYFATVVYSASETGDLPEQTLNDKISVNVHRKWFAGVCNSIPTTSSEVRSLSSGGLYTGSGTYKFNVDQWKMFAVCIPTDTIKELTLTAYPGNFIEDKGVCGDPITIPVEGANGSQAIPYKMYIVKSVMSNDADTFTFKTV